MHSHERTLLAKLGFSDADKRNPLHDRACAYLAEDAQARRIVALYDAGELPPDRATAVDLTPGRDRSVIIPVADAESNIASDLTRWEHGSIAVTPALEKPLSKGEGQYATTIGFVDVTVAWTVSASNTGWSAHRRLGFSTYDRHTSDYRHVIRSGAVIVEVKIGPMPVGDVLRQMKLYASYVAPHATTRSRDMQYYHDPDNRFTSGRFGMVLATPYPISKDEAGVLRREGIRHIRLGDAFKAWCDRPLESEESTEL